MIKHSCKKMAVDISSQNYKCRYEFKSSTRITYSIAGPNAATAVVESAVTAADDTDDAGDAEAVRGRRAGQLSAVY